MDAPKNVDIEDFMHDWRAWYTGLMPSWRSTGLGTTKWPLHRHVPEREDWSQVRKGERNGVFLFVVCLYWWKTLTSKGSNERDQYESALEDVLWLFPFLINASTQAHGGGGAPSNARMDTSVVQTRTRKRKHDDHDALAPQDEEPNKRKTRSVRNEVKEVQEAPRAVRSTRATAGTNARSTRSARH